MGKRALVVVDEGPDVSDVVEAVLKSAGMECVTLTKSADAPILLSNESFGLLALDLHTLADAFALARLARESGFNRSTPIILMSDDQSTAAVAGGFGAGVSFFLYKPVDEGRLIKLVRATSDASAPKKRRFRRVPLPVPRPPRLRSARARSGNHRRQPEWNARPRRGAFPGRIGRAHQTLLVAGNSTHRRIGICDADARGESHGDSIGPPASRGERAIAGISIAAHSSSGNWRRSGKRLISVSVQIPAPARHGVITRLPSLAPQPIARSRR